MSDKFQPARGDKTKLSYADREILETQVLPTARRWCESIRGLRSSGENTLRHWGELVPEFRGKRA